MGIYQSVINLHLCKAIIIFRFTLSSTTFPFFKKLLEKKIL